MPLGIIGNGYRGRLKFTAEPMRDDISSASRWADASVEQLRKALAAIDAIDAADITDKVRREQRIAAAKKARTDAWRGTARQMVSEPKSSRHSATHRAREADRAVTLIEIERAKLRLAEFAADPVNNATKLRAAVEAGDADAILTARLLPADNALRTLADRRHVASVIGTEDLAKLEREEVRAALVQQRLEAFDATIDYIVATGEEPALDGHALLLAANTEDDLLQRAEALGVLDKPLPVADLNPPPAGAAPSSRDLLNHANQLAATAAGGTQ